MEEDIRTNDTDVGDSTAGRSKLNRQVYAEGPDELCPMQVLHLHSETRVLRWGISQAENILAHLKILRLVHEFA